MTGVRGRTRLAGLALCVLTLSCGRGPAEPTQAPVEHLHLAPACSLAPAAGLAWFFEAKPKAIAAITDLVPALSLIISEARLTAFASASGGVDLRSTEELCVARYESAGGHLLSIARTKIDPNRIERAFVERTTRVLERSVVVQRPPVVRIEAQGPGGQEGIGIFGTELVVHEQGAPGLLGAAIAFARGKLRRSPSATDIPDIARARRELGDAPVFFFARGPFDRAPSGLGAVLGASNAVGASAWFAGPPSKLGVRIVFVGGGNTYDARASERLLAATLALQESALGRLLGLDHPVTAPTVRTTGDALVLEATLSAMTLAQGLRDATSADVADFAPPR